MNFLKKSLLSKLVGYFFLLSAFTVSILAWTVNDRARDSLKQSVFDRLTVATSLKEYQLNQWIDDQRRDVVLISQLPEIQREVEVLLKQKPGDEAYKTSYEIIKEYLTNIAGIKPQIDDISILTNGGIVVFSTDTKRVGKYQPLGNTTTYFNPEKDFVVKPNFYTSVITGKPMMTFATPITSKERGRVAVVAVDLNLDGIDAIIREKTGLGKTGETYLVGSLERKNTFISGEKYGQKVFVDGISSIGIDSAMNARDGSGLYKNYAKVPVIGVYVWLENQNLALLAEMNQSEAFAPARQLARDILLLGLSSATLLLVAVYLMSRRITQPVLAITNAAIEVANGNLMSTAPVMTQDEIGILAQAFNKMTSQLKLSNAQVSEYSRTLEHQVEERTAELARAMSETQAALAYVGAVIDNLADALLVTDPNGRINQANPALEVIYGLKESVLLGQGVQQLLGEEARTLIEETKQNPGEAKTKEFKLPGNRIGKAVATAIFKVGPAEAGENLYTGTVILIRDITREKEVDQMKTDFISTVSHELRTPLTSVLGFAKLIQKKLEENIFPVIQTDDKKVQRAMRQVGENIDIIVSEGQRLTTLINDVLDVAKMEAGKLDWKMEPLRITEILDRALASTSALFEQKGLQLVREVDPELPEFLGDRDRLIQVVINLISNAVKFTDQGAVTCKAYRAEREIVVSVIDTGMGIAEVDQPKVFEKFKQVGDTLTDKPKGTGLGLPICKEILEHHGGRIWVESKLGQGSIFSFALPFISSDAISEIKTVDIDKLVQELRDQATSTQLTQNVGQKTVLVVDDDISIRVLLRQQLETVGYRVREAEGGMEAISQAKKDPPHLIILDVMMPKINGFDVAAVMKNDPLTMDIPIIIYSGIEDQNRAYRIGVDLYLTKSGESEELLKQVDLLITQGTSKKKVFIVDEDVSTMRTLAEALEARGYSVVEIMTGEEFKERVQTLQPDMIIADADFWTQSEIVRSLQYEKGMQNISLLLLRSKADETMMINSGNGNSAGSEIPSDSSSEADPNNSSVSS
ncbi:transcriptional regulator [Leptolyngbya sp. 'hensonii']|uniref:response regulator n=1 Tax=Leptolyngbya sp. 'hensonii' TaxID=1922337 RepID=UPI0009501913|nr:response regulator [Leptolyngbya sp. 'hensonii']OLP17975.1 transcriptional regulator [Leptolyngbya sp. 'hensonii']